MIVFSQSFWSYRIFSRLITPMIIVVKTQNLKLQGLSASLGQSKAHLIKHVLRTLSKEAQSTCRHTFFILLLKNYEWLKFNFLILEVMTWTIKFIIQTLFLRCCITLEFYLFIYMSKDINKVNHYSYTFWSLPFRYMLIKS